MERVSFYGAARENVLGWKTLVEGKEKTIPEPFPGNTVWENASPALKALRESSLL